MLIGIASGTYSSIFIASPVLTAWKEREPGFVRRRQRIAEVEGGLVPAFADDVQVAKLADDNETEAEIAATSSAKRRGRRGREPEAGRRAERRGAPRRARAEPTSDGAGARRRRDGDGANPESAERRKRNEERRAKRAQRRKGKRR